MGTGDIPESPAGAQLRWFLESIAAPDTMTAADVISRYVKLWPKSAWFEGDEAGRAAWKKDWDEYGEFEVESIVEPTPFEVSIVLVPKEGRRQRITLVVEEEEPHRIRFERWSRVYDFDLQIFPATEADAATLSDIERRSLVVLGDTSVVTDRGDDYFAAARLIDRVTVYLAVVDGDPAAVAWGAQAPVRLGGEDLNATYFFHLRVTPDHQRKGLWGALDGAVWTTYGETSDIYIGYWLAENTAWAHVAEQVQARPGFVRRDWVPTVYRLLVPTASIATPAVDGARPRRATPADAARIVEILNACHEGEELYVPYTEECFTARLSRDPSYGWSDLWLTDRAVVGVWRAGDAVEVRTITGGETVRSRRGHVLDYGFLPGGEDDLLALLGAVSGDLAGRGIDQLSLFTSRGARTQPVLKQLEGTVEAYRFNTGAAAMIADTAQETGIYTDHLYF